MMIEDKEYNVELFTSKLSGKKKLLVNGAKIYEVKKYSFVESLTIRL
jgi:hypothetical protein